MDPDANLAEQRQLIAEMQHEIDMTGNCDATKTERLLELVEALDEWIAKGGFLPKAWQKK